MQAASTPLPSTHRLLPPIVAMHALPNHFAADYAEHDECNPVIEDANKAAGRDAGPPTDYRSDRFDEAKDQACPQSFGKTRLVKRCSFTKGGRERVGGHAEC